MMGDAAPQPSGAELSMKLSVIAPDNETAPVGATAQELGPAEIKALRAGGSLFNQTVKKNKNMEGRRTANYLACV